MTASYEVGSGEPWPPPKEARVKPKASWREIPLEQIDWDIPSVGKTRGPKRVLYDLSRKRGDYSHQIGDWHDWTLGKLADVGENTWLRAPSVGHVCTLIIKEIIDRAAAGEDVTEKDAGAHSYVPQPWPRRTET
jgi:hypothetical protein